MKTNSWLALALTLFSLGARGQVAPPSNGREAVLVETGPNHQVWQGLTVDEQGRTNVSSITELATGMNYWDGQQWTPSDAAFDAADDGFLASRVQHPVHLLSNLNQIGAVKVRTPDGIMLRSTPVGIGLYDAASGASVILGAVKDCSGVLVGSNQVVYANAFSGLCADIIYTLERGSFEQDVVITGRLNPADYGFPTNTTRIQIFTEFYDGNKPERIRRPLRVEKDEAVRRRMASPDLVDEMLGFGEFVIGTGKAFTAPTLAHTNGVQSVVAKEFKTVAGRTFLIEAVEYPAIRAGLETLPECELQTASVRPVRGSKAEYAAIPPLPSKREHASASHSNSRAKRMAKAETGGRAGLVIDYVATLGSTSSAFTFQGDTTYLVSGVVNLNGPTTIEGGAVVKYQIGKSVTLNYTLTCNTSSYRPAIFTAVDDHSVGEQIGTGTINPSGYANPALFIVYPSTSATLSYLRFCYAQAGLIIQGPSGFVDSTVKHSQFVNCIRGIELQGTGTGSGSGSGCSVKVTVNNCLMANVQYPLKATIAGSEYSANLTHCTIDVATTLASSVTGASFFVNVTNSVLARINVLFSGDVSISGNYNGFDNVTPLFGNTVNRWQSASPFQSHGAGNYYLASGHSFRNSGTTTGVPISLRNDLKKMTTYHPVQLVSAITVPTILSPVAQRDTDTPDLGYHYDALDYVLNNVTLSATLTLTNGVAVGLQNAYGLDILFGSTVVSEGAPAKMNRVVSLANVQEQPTAAGGSTFMKLNAGVSAYDLDFRFTDLSVGQGALGTVVNTGGSFDYSVNQISFSDCWLHDGVLTMYPNSPASVTAAFTNNIIERCKLTLGRTTAQLTTPFKVYLYNNLFLGDPNSATPGTPPALALSYDWGMSNPNWEVHDNLFDKATQTVSGNSTVSILRSNDGFTSGTAQNLVGSGDQTGFMVTYQAGALGNYYLPTTATQLIDHGSRTADLAGLHHYTTTTGNSKEQNSQVDIGFHYVAAEPDRQGLVAHWRLDEESGTVAQDSSENYLNGALSGASWTSGTLEGAAYFNGSDQYVSVPNSSLLSFPSGSFSISVWVNPQDSLGRAVLAKGEGGQPDWSEYILTVNSGGFWFKGAWRASTALSSVPVGVWTHLVVAFDGTTLRFYKNGTLMNSLVPTGTYATVTSYGFYLSRQGAGGYNNFAGLIDEVRFYSRALSASEVGYLFNKAAYDYDGDGLADYLEDRNGNGVYDAGETDWQTYNSQYGLNGSPVLQVFTPLKP